MSNLIEAKAFSFAVRIVRLYQHAMKQPDKLPGTEVLFRQLLRSGTSVGANIAEAIDAQSAADFISKRKIARKEARETSYWLCLLHTTDYLTNPGFSSLSDDCNELLRLLTSSLRKLEAKSKTRKR